LIIHGIYPVFSYGSPGTSQAGGFARSKKPLFFYDNARVLLYLRWKRRGLFRIVLYSTVEL